MTTDSLAALREIFLDPDNGLKSRIEAAETILSYQAPKELVEEAIEFLTQLSEDRQTPVTLRLVALKIIRKAEASKVPTRTDGSEDEHAEREKARDFLKMKRRLAIYKAGLSPPPPGCFDDLDAKDFDPLEAVKAQHAARVAEEERLKQVRNATTKTKSRDDKQ